jgi:hypothetical protein
MAEEVQPTGAGEEEEEPVITGTLFLTALLLVLIIGFWVLMYITLIGM